MEAKKQGSVSLRNTHSPDQIRARYFGTTSYGCVFGSKENRRVCQINAVKYRFYSTPCYQNSSDEIKEEIKLPESPAPDIDFRLGIRFFLTHTSLLLDAYAHITHSAICILSGSVSLTPRVFLMCEKAFWFSPPNLIPFDGGDVPVFVEVQKHIRARYYINNILLDLCRIFVDKDGKRSGEWSHQDIEYLSLAGFLDVWKSIWIPPSIKTGFQRSDNSSMWKFYVISGLPCAELHDIKPENRFCEICCLPLSEERNDSHAPVQTPCPKPHIFGRSCRIQYQIFNLDAQQWTIAILKWFGGQISVLNFIPIDWTETGTLATFRKQLPTNSWGVP